MVCNTIGLALFLFCFASFFQQNSMERHQITAGISKPFCPVVMMDGNVCNLVCSATLLCKGAFTAAVVGYYE
jgi:hypothetical protein